MQQKERELERSKLQNFILERSEVMKKFNQDGDGLINLTQHEWNEIERTLNAIDRNRFAKLKKEMFGERRPNITLEQVINSL